jgi:crotonobetaine/carnitine-CoA ligase
VQRNEPSAEGRPAARGAQLPRPEQLTVRHALERYAAEWPDRPFVTFEETTWTRQEALMQAYGAAAALADAGVTRGARVGVMLGNSPAFVRSWWGCALLGATLVPVNPSLRGTVLADVVARTRPQVMVIDEDGRDRLSAVADLPPLIDPAGFRDAGPPPPLIEARYRDIVAIVMTSGTTGLSKLVPLTALQLWYGGAWFSSDSAGDGDTFLMDLPLFHAAALYHANAALHFGVRLSVRSGPTLRDYWRVAADAGATLSIVLSSMVTFLSMQAPSDHDTAHRIRRMLSVPAPEDAAGFRRRFGVAQIWSGYGLSELPTPLTSTDAAEIDLGSCGRLRSGFEVRIADEDDETVPDGTPGELLVRADEPWLIATEYLDDPSATASAWRNGWFHTGDRLRHEGGHYYFVDRLKDSIRRRGENISSAEVEREVVRYPGVVEAAVVPFATGRAFDEEVKAWIVVDGDTRLDFAALLAFCAEHMPHYMVPRYFEVTQQLPKTPSHRVQKFRLRALGNGPLTWDREAVGLTVTRSGVVVEQPRDVLPRSELDDAGRLGTTPG